MNRNNEYETVYDYHLGSKFALWYFPALFVCFIAFLAISTLVAGLYFLVIQREIIPALSTLFGGVFIFGSTIMMGISLIMRSPSIIVSEAYFCIKIPFLRYQSEKIGWDKAQILYPTQVQKLMGTERNIGFLVETELIHPIYEVVGMYMAGERCFFVSNKIKEYEKLFNLFQTKLPASA